MNDPAIAYGVATREQTAGLTGLQVMQAILDGRLPQAPISRTLGFRLAEVGDGLWPHEQVGAGRLRRLRAGLVAAGPDGGDGDAGAGKDE